MPSLSLATIPGFTEIDDSVFDAGNTASESDMKALNAAAKFAAVRPESFWGWYKHGETVELPVSLADGYEYTREELVYSWSVWWTGAPPGGACAGTQTPPARGATSGQGQLLQMGFDVDQATGLVDCFVSYFKTSQMDTTDGILMVVTHALRMR